MKKSSSDKPATGMSANGTPFPNDRDRFILRETLTSKNQEFIQSLVTAAKEGDEDYAYALYHLAWFATMNLQVIVDPKRDFARKLAPFVHSWPILVSLSPDYLSAIPKFIKEVGLGTKFSDPVDPIKAGHTNTESRQLALTIILLIDGMRKGHYFACARQHNEELLSAARVKKAPREEMEKYSAYTLFYEQNEANMLSQCEMALYSLGVLLRIGQQVERSDFAAWVEKALELPNLSQNSVEDWMNVGMQIILRLTGGRPEDNASLWDLGKYKVQYFYRKEAKRRLCVKKIDAPKVLALAKKLEADRIALKSARSALCEGVVTRLKDAGSKMLRDKVIKDAGPGK